MVRAFLPQKSTGNIQANTNFPPQSVTIDGGISPGVDSEIVEETTGVFNPLIYDDGTETGFVLIQET